MGFVPCWTNNLSSNRVVDRPILRISWWETKRQNTTWPFGSRKDTWFTESKTQLGLAYYSVRASFWCNRTWNCSLYVLSAGTQDFPDGSARPRRRCKPVLPIFLKICIKMKTKSAVFRSLIVIMSCLACSPNKVFHSVVKVLKMATECYQGLGRHLCSIHLNILFPN